MNYNSIDLTSAVDLRKALISLTDGVYNTSDTASFDDNDIAFMNVIRNYNA